MTRTWRYRQQVWPKKAHLWLFRLTTLCGIYGRPPVGGSFEPPVAERCRRCIRMELEGEA